MKAIKLKKHLSIVYHNKNCVEVRDGVWNSNSYIFSDSDKEEKLWKLFEELNPNEDMVDDSSQSDRFHRDFKHLTEELSHLDLLDDPNEWNSDDNQRYFHSASTNITPSSQIAVISDGVVSRFIAENLKHHPNKYDSAGPEHFSELRTLLTTQDLTKKSEIEISELSGSFSALENRFVICVEDEPDPIFFKNFDMIARNLNISWIHGVTDGPYLFIGPTFIQRGLSPCYGCLESRFLMNCQEPVHYQNYKKALLKESVTHGACVQARSHIPLLLAGHILHEVHQFLSSDKNITTGKVLAIHLPTMCFTYHDILKLSGCRSCDSFTPAVKSQLFFDYQSCVQETL